VINGTTGANVGTLAIAPFMTGPGSGIYPINMIACADDGVIYACNLADTSLQQFRIYQWDTESSAPSMPFINDFSNAPRVGDTLDVRGTSFNTLILAGVQSGSAPSAQNKGYITISTNGGAPYSGGNRVFTTTPPNEGDHRLGITFGPGDTVIGTQGGGQPVRYSSFAAFPSVLLASPTLTSPGERPMDFATIAGKPILATVDTSSSLVRVYDFTNPASPLLLTSATTIVGPSNDNSFGVGQVRFGAISGATATLYALNSNNGIQAFTLTVPEPVSLGLIVIPLAMLRRCRK
jgi:hypothetical protein